MTEEQSQPKPINHGCEQHNCRMPFCRLTPELSRPVAGRRTCASVAPSTRLTPRHGVGLNELLGLLSLFGGLWLCRHLDCLNSRAFLVLLRGLHRLEQASLCVSTNLSSCHDLLLGLTGWKSHPRDGGLTPELSRPTAGRQQRAA